MNAELAELAAVVAELVEALRALQGHYPRTDFALSELQTRANTVRDALKLHPNMARTLGLPKGKVRT